MKERHKRRGKRKREMMREGDNVFAMEPQAVTPNEAIERFQQYKEKKKNMLQQSGMLTPREKFEQERPPDDLERLETQIQKLRQPTPSIAEDITYDIYNCPYNPPPKYPFTWNVMDVLENWNPDETDLPKKIHHGLCVFDWRNTTQAEMAQNYREHELPFVAQHFPEAMKAAERWTTPGYLEELLGDEPIRNEHSQNNHFMYWKTRRPQPDFDPPTDMVELTYPEWLAKAQAVQQSTKQTKEEHWYFRLNGMLKNHAELYDEMPFFDPTLGKSFTMINPTSHRGINCRFGMKVCCYNQLDDD
jgi:hypothetical protein